MRIIACNVDKYYKMIAHRSFATHHDQWFVHIQQEQFEIEQCMC